MTYQTNADSFAAIAKSVKDFEPFPRATLEERKSEREVECDNECKRERKLGWEEERKKERKKEQDRK